MHGSKAFCQLASIKFLWQLQLKEICLSKYYWRALKLQTLCKYSGALDSIVERLGLSNEVLYDLASLRAAELPTLKVYPLRNQWEFILDKHSLLPIVDLIVAHCNICTAEVIWFQQIHATYLKCLIRFRCQIQNNRHLHWHGYLMRHIEIKCLNRMTMTIPRV